MANKKKTETPVTNSNVNNNTNINNIHNHNNINIDKSALEQLVSSKAPEEKKETKWLTKAIVGGIITIAVAVAIYYLTGTGSKYGPDALQNRSSVPNVVRH